MENSDNKDNLAKEVSEENVVTDQENQEENAPEAVQDDIRNDQDDVAGKIFIGGLSWQTTEETLRYYFSKYGELADVALMIDKKTGKPRGFGFIKMMDPKAADVVMEHDHTIDGRLVDVKRALPRDLAPGPARCFSLFVCFFDILFYC
jgi:RNA recognition motif-containing protein